MKDIVSKHIRSLFPCSYRYLNFSQRYDVPVSLSPRMDVIMGQTPDLSWDRKSFSNATVDTVWLVNRFSNVNLTQNFKLECGVLLYLSVLVRTF